MKNINVKVKEKISDFFDWIKGAELIELNSCNIKEDPVRPELDIEFRTSYGRKIYGVKYKKEICAIMCFGYTNEIPKTVKELDLMTKDAYLQSALRDRNVGKIAVAYTAAGSGVLDLVQHSSLNSRVPVVFDLPLRSSLG